MNFGKVSLPGALTAASEDDYEWTARDRFSFVRWWNGAIHAASVDVDINRSVARRKFGKHY